LLAPFKNESLEFVDIGEINKRATSVVDAGSTLGIAKQFSLLFP
jgi:hypothetical protein